jgi:HAMP domain-containing protein
MGLRLKFNLVLVVIFLLGLGVTGYQSYDLLHKNAREEVLRNAGVIMESALAMRAYTQTQVRPVLRNDPDTFVQQGIPAYAVAEIMTLLRKKYPEYAYKEAALNPTNPRNRAVEWETDVVNTFRGDDKRLEISGIRETPTGPSLYLARPLQIKDAACLACHTMADMSPPGMVKIYGASNGYGWKHMEVVGAQVVSVPMSLPVRNANNAFYTFMVSLTAVFVVLFVALNVMLSIMIVRPIRQMSVAADQISTGNMDVADLKESGKDEVSLLAKSFNRMRRSLEKAIQMIDQS